MREDWKRYLGSWLDTDEDLKQIVADLKISFLDVSHWPGVAKATGTVIIRPNENITNRAVKI